MKAVTHIQPYCPDCGLAFLCPTREPMLCLFWQRCRCGWRGFARFYMEQA